MLRVSALLFFMAFLLSAMSSNSLCYLPSADGSFSASQTEEGQESDTIPSRRLSRRSHNSMSLHRRRIIAYVRMAGGDHRIGAAKLYPLF